MRDKWNLKSMFHVKSRDVFSAIQLDGLKTSYPSWIEILILKNKLVYHPEEHKWMYREEVLQDGDFMVFKLGGIVHLSPQEFEKEYEVCL